MSEEIVWQRFTNPATRVIHLAQEEAQQLQASMIAVEHLLLGLLREEDGNAGQLLRHYGVTLARVRNSLSEYTPITEEASGKTRIPLGTQARQALAYALDEAKNIQQALGIPALADTEHILLGLLREDDEASNAVTELLTELGIASATLRKEIYTTLGLQSADEEYPNLEGDKPLDSHENLEVFRLAYQAALDLFKITQSLSADVQPSSADLRLLSRQICTAIAKVWWERRDREIFDRKVAITEELIIEMQVRLEFVVGYGYAAPTAIQVLHTAYEKVLESLEKLNHPLMRE